MDYVMDTLVLSRLIHPDLYESDQKRIKRGTLPQRLSCRHSLEAWGYRVGENKAEYTGGFDEWNPEMESYCEQDVETLHKLWVFLNVSAYDPRAVEIEHKVQQIIFRQEQYGFLFDHAKAVALQTKLVAHRAGLQETIAETFHPRFLRDGDVKPVKVNNKKLGYVAGTVRQPVAYTEFNPSSRDHIASWFKHLYGWKPVDFTADGKPKVDEDVLTSLPYPGASLLAEYLMVVRRLGQLAEGNEAWLKRVGDDGRMHGSIITNGAVTGRMTHAKPNMGQVPAVHSPYGPECRELFIASPGKVLVGGDASALELRGLAGYMARYDNGAYIKTVTEGRKADGTEIHYVNQKALGIDSRDAAKTWFYAFIYGAGDEKLGLILKASSKVSAGRASRKRFLTNLPALGKLVLAVQAKTKKGKSIRGLDGRVIPIRAQHSALNTLLQSAGAIIMKKALVILDDSLKSKYIPGEDYEFVANVHDEWQIECNPEHAEHIASLAVTAMEEAGKFFKFPCPITGEARIGRNWRETH
jgi:hypothetical protein